MQHIHERGESSSATLTCFGYKTGRTHRPKAIKVHSAVLVCAAGEQSCRSYGVREEGTEISQCIILSHRSRAFACITHNMNSCVNSSPIQGRTGPGSYFSLKVHAINQNIHGKTDTNPTSGQEPNCIKDQSRQNAYAAMYSFCLHLDFHMGLVTSETCWFAVRHLEHYLHTQGQTN